MDTSAIIALVAVFAVLLILAGTLRMCVGEDSRQLEVININTRHSGMIQLSNQTTDIWNISGRVNNQDGPVTTEPQRWPTHDHHVSIDSFVIPETQQHNKKDRIPPPPYSEVDLPTYEQATALPKPKDELASVHVVPSSSRSNCDASATS